MGKKYAYLTLYYYCPEKDQKIYLIGQKKFMNVNDGYIGTNPLQFVFPGGNLLNKEKTIDGAKREFEEETGFNLMEFKPLNVKKIYTNKYADFFLAEIPTKSKDTFEYSKQKVIAMGNFYEFDFFEWLPLENIKEKLMFKPDIEIMIDDYCTFLKNYSGDCPTWIYKNNAELIYNKVKNKTISTAFKKLVKNHIIKRSDNDWFVDFINEIKD